MKKRTSIAALTLLTIFFSIAACTKEKAEKKVDCTTVTYSATIKPIIETKCAVSACHDGTAGVGNFKTYAGLQPYLADGKFKTQVLINKTMPKNSTLTTEQIEQITCWVDAGSPEN